MNSFKINKLIQIAKKRMENSTDPVHEINHTKRVVQHAIKISRDLNLSETEKQVLIMSAWWHDVGRTITKKPSMLWMLLLDDIFSALILWKETFKLGLFGGVVGRSTRILFCKNKLTGKFLKKIILTKKSQLILDILNDADNLDILHTKRLEDIFSLVEKKYIYHLNYRLIVWYCLHSTKLQVKTEAAKKYLFDLLKQIVKWFKNPIIKNWHIDIFGFEWTEKTIQNLNFFLSKFQIQDKIFIS